MKISKFHLVLKATKTRSWQRLKCLRAEYAPQSQQPITPNVTSCWLLDQRVMFGDL